MTSRLGRGATLLAALMIVSAASAQTLVRIAASAPEIAANAVFFHNRTVALIATPTEIDGIWRIDLPAPQTLILAWRTPPPTSGSVEVRGVFYDVGRFAPDDSRLDPYGARSLIRLLTHDQWPGRDRFFIISGASWTVPPPSTERSLRALALTPTRFEGQTVTVRGRFRGQNLFGDLPVWPRQSQWDFVLQSGDAAVWISGLRPRGHGFDLDPKSRRDTTRFLSVTGVVKVVQGLPLVAATSLELVDAIDEPEETAAEPPPPPPPAPTVIFSAPLDGESDVAPAGVVRIQFSRPMLDTSFANHIRVSYPAGTAAAPPTWSVTYKPTSLSLEIAFAAPLASNTRVTVDLLAGITSKDGQPLTPASITFTTGG